MKVELHLWVSLLRGFQWTPLNPQAMGGVPPQAPFHPQQGAPMTQQPGPSECLVLVCLAHFRVDISLVIYRYPLVSFLKPP